MLSVGQLYGCDVHKVTSVQFISLDSELIELLDQRIIEVKIFFILFLIKKYFSYKNFYHLEYFIMLTHINVKIFLI